MSQCPYCGTKMILLSHYHEEDEYYCEECEVIVKIVQLDSEEAKRIESGLQNLLHDDLEDLIW